MATTPIISQNDGQRVTVNQLMRDPTTIPRRAIREIDQQFIAGDLLRTASPAPSGVVLYNESTPMFTDTGPFIISEWGEIPTVQSSLGQPKMVRTVKRGGAIKVSWEMRSRNDIDTLNTQLAQLRNTMTRSFEDAFLQGIVGATGVLTGAATAVWSSGSSAIRKDVNGAKFAVKDAAADAGGVNKFGFQPDTLVISTETELDLLNSTEMTQPFVGNIADRNIAYTGVLPQKYLGLDVFVSWRLDTYFPNGALIMQRKVVGGISDERALRATGMYSERGNDATGGANETWRSDTTRISAVFIDQPKAVYLLSGVHT